MHNGPWPDAHANRQPNDVILWVLGTGAARAHARDAPWRTLGVDAPCRPWCWAHDVRRALQMHKLTGTVVAVAAHAWTATELNDVMHTCRMRAVRHVVVHADGRALEHPDAAPWLVQQLTYHTGTRGRLPNVCHAAATLADAYRHAMTHAHSTDAWVPILTYDDNDDGLPLQNHDKHLPDVDLWGDGAPVRPRRGTGAMAYINNDGDRPTPGPGCMWLQGGRRASRADWRQATYVTPAGLRDLWGACDALVILPDISWEHATRVAAAVRYAVIMVRRRPLGWIPLTRDGGDTHIGTPHDRS